MIWCLIAGFIGFILGIALTIAVFCWFVSGMNKAQKCANW